MDFFCVWVGVCGMSNNCESSFRAVAVVVVVLLELVLVDSVDVEVVLDVVNDLDSNFSAVHISVEKRLFW